MDISILSRKEDVYKIKVLKECGVNLETDA